LVSDSALSVIRVNAIPDSDVSISEDVGAKSATVDQPAQYTVCGEALQVSAWLAQTLSKTFDVSNSESPTDQAVEIDAPGDQVPASFAVLEPTAIRQHELIKDLGLDKRQVVATAATSNRRKSACPCFISIAHQASAGDCLRLGNEHDRSRSPSGQRNSFHPTTLRRISRGSG
jgi:hypothetical protein